MTILARRCSLASLGIALLLASCRARTADVSGPRSDLAEIRTDRTTYVLGSKNGRYVFADTVEVRFVNRSSVPLYFRWFHIEYRIYTGQRGDPAARQLPREARRTNPFDVRWRE